MKKYSILIALLIMSLKLYSQNTEPGPFEFTYGDNTSPQVIDPNDFLQTKMLFGFQWSGSKNMHDVIGCLFSSRHFKMNAMMSVEKFYPLNVFFNNLRRFHYETQIIFNGGGTGAAAIDYSKLNLVC